MMNIDHAHVPVVCCHCVRLPGSFLRFLFIITCIGFFSFNGKSQTYIGLSGGADLYDQVDFRAAGVIEWVKNDLYSWQTEIIYVKRENLDLLQLLPQNGNYVRPVVSYVEIPFLFKIKLNIPGANLYALVGPKVGYAVAAYSSLWKENNQVVNEVLVLEDLEVAGWDFGMSLGMGLEKNITNDKKIFVEFRYYLGVKDLFPGQETGVYNEGKSFNLGFLIPIRKE